MSKETLKVKNFGPIKEADLDLRKVTVFIGEQASGKSCLAKLLAISKRISLINDPSRLINAFSTFSLERFLLSKSSIDFTTPFYALKIRKKELRVTSTQEFQQFLFIAEKVERIMEEHDIENTPKNAQYFSPDELSQIEKYNNLHNATTITSEYISTERVIVSLLSENLVLLENDETKLPQHIKRMAADYQKALNLFGTLEVSKFDLSSVDFKSIDDQLSQQIYYNKSVVNLENSSSGLQSLIPLLYLVELNSKFVQGIQFIIEEPELNLYPTTQKKLVEYLIEKCTKGDNRLVITTHSPYILTALNNCIEAANVRKSNPAAAAEVDALVPRESQIDFEDVAAYFVGGGTARSIMNHENQLIDANALDEISEEIGRTFDRLLDLKYQNQD